MDFEVIPPASYEERLVLERAVELLYEDAMADEPRAASTWWRRGAEEAVGSADDGEPGLELYAPSPRKTRGATRA